MSTVSSKSTFFPHCAGINANDEYVSVISHASPQVCIWSMKGTSTMFTFTRCSWYSIANLNQRLYIGKHSQYKVATAVIESSYSWKLLNVFFQQKASCSRQAGDGRSSE